LILVPVNRSHLSSFVEINCFVFYQDEIFVHNIIYLILVRINRSLFWISFQSCIILF